MGTVVLDASVVLALFDPNDQHHAAAAETVRGFHRSQALLRIPTSVVSEVLVGAARQGNDAVFHRLAQMQAAFGEFCTLSVEIAVAAALLRARHGSVRLPDAIVLATGQVIGADVVLTADKRWRSIDPRVQALASA
jgi:predicted nucleic acid-binding protein